MQLWRRGSPDFLPVEWVGGLDDQGYTNPDGTFSLTSTDPEDNHFMRMALREANGVRLKDWFGINDWGTDFGGGRNDVPVRDVGAWLFSAPDTSHQCAVWRGFHRAHQDQSPHSDSTRASVVPVSVPRTGRQSLPRAVAGRGGRPRVACVSGQKPDRSSATSGVRDRSVRETPGQAVHGKACRAGCAPGPPLGFR